MPDYIEEYLRQIKDNRDINQWDTLYTHLDVKEPLLMSVRLHDERGGRDERDVKDVVAQEKRLIISGASGMGKSTTLKWLTLVYAENYLEGAERLIPFYVDLGRFRHGLFYDHALMIAHKNGLEEEGFKELLDGGKLAIFLDGLDLLGGSEDFEPVSEIQNFMSGFSRCKFVLSSRPGFFEGFKSSCKVSELVELDDPKIKGYVHKYLGEGDKADTLISRIFDSRNERLKLLCKNPMMLHLVIWLQENDKIADDRAGIYRESVEGIITHYREKGKTLLSNEQLVRDVLKELAFSMQKENTVRLDYEGTLDVTGSCISPERYGNKISAKEVLDDCFGLGLLHKDGGDVRFGFHQSFQEYFAAVKLKEIFEYGYDISESFSHPKWEDALVFLSEITERPDELIEDVVGAGEIFLAAKLTAHVDDYRVENLCALLLDKIDSEFDLEKWLAIESFVYVGGGAVGLLIGMLNDADLQVRNAALTTLVRIRDERDVGPLIDGLQSVNPRRIGLLTTALGIIGDERAVEPLIDMLKDDDPFVRLQSATALGMIGDERAVGPLIDMLKDDDPFVRSASALALWRFKDGRAVEPLIDVLKDDDPLVRSMATKALGTIGDKRAVKPLISVLQDDDDPSVRTDTAKALGRIGDERAVEPFIDRLQDDDPSVRTEAAIILGLIGDKRAVKPLIDALQSDDPFVQREVVKTLGRIRDKGAVKPLINTLQDDDDPFVRNEAAKALGRIGDERAIEPLINALREADAPFVRTDAAKALWVIGGAASVESLINILKDEEDSSVRWMIANALNFLCGTQHRKKLEPLLESDDNYIANAAFGILHSIKLKEQKKVKIFKELKYLLRWDSIPGNDSDRLLKYLLGDYGVAWAERTKIRKSDDKTLIISKDENSAEIKIDEKGKKATLKLSDGRTCDLNLTKKSIKSTYTTPSGVMDAEEMLTDAHLGALIDRLKLVPDGITVVDYGCGKGTLLGRMKEIERELGKIHYIGVDISRGNQYLAGRTAKKYGVADKLKSCDFMKPDEFFSKDIDIGHVFFSHVIHEIVLKDLPEILYRLLSKMKAGSRITILEQVILLEPERDFVTWSASDFDILFSDFAEVSSRPYQTGRGHELISVDLKRLNTDASRESIRKRCLEVYERKKERVRKERKSSDLGEDGHGYLSELYANIVEQMDEHQKSMNV